MAQKAAPVSAAPEKKPAKALKVEKVSDSGALAQRCRELAADAEWMAFYYGNELSVATDTVRMSLPVGGDLFSAGVSPEEAVEAVKPLLTADCPKALYNVKALPGEAVCGDVIDVMLAAYALNPQRSSFDADALCAEAEVDGFDSCPAQAIHDLSEIQRRELEENDPCKHRAGRWV